MRATFFILLFLAFTGCGGRKDSVDSKQDPEVPGTAIKPNSGGELTLIAGGTFTMGDANGEPDEKPHTVAVSSFHIDRYLVTQEIYQKVMGVNPSQRKNPKNPVEKTQWVDAVRFCNKCSDIDGLKPCYDLETWKCNFAADGYRLPTEAEWEFACRAGSTGRFCCGDDEAKLAEFAWFRPASENKPHPVGLKKANAWGLFDMHGNVWQWCNDWYAETYAESPKENPTGPAEGELRVLRGGAFDKKAEKCRSAFRFKHLPTFGDACVGADAFGFRRVRADHKIVQEQKKPAKLDPASLKGTIVFVSDRGGKLNIWTMHASGKNAKQLTKGIEPDADPRFSPDGKRIMYTALRGGFPQIWMMNRDGSEPKFVTNGSQGNWSPDGKSIIFIEDNQTFIRDLAAGKDRLVSPKNWERCTVPAFSPDGKRFAVASRHLGNMGIFILSLDGKEITQLKAEEACCTPQWSKDGKKMLCQSVKGHVHEAGVAEKRWEQLTFGADVQHDARYSPDGTMIVFCRAPAAEGPWQICVRRLDGDDDEFVTITREGSNLLPDWITDE